MKIGIYGGSFNPPHNMHLKMSLELLDKNYIDKIIYVPTGTKYPKANLITNIDRLNMLNLMIENNPNLDVSDYELKQELIYTYQTLEYFKNKYPTDTIYFILGSDLLKEFSNWKNYEYILEKFKVLVTLRNQDDIEDLQKLDLPFKENIIYTNLKLETLSSTEIREAIKTENEQIVASNLHPKVLKYIKEKGLYRG